MRRQQAGEAHLAGGRDARLGAGGDAVVLAGRRAQLLQEVAGQLGDRALAITADAASAPDMARVAEAATARFGSIDTLVANAGGPGAGTAAGIDDDSWADSLRSNLTTCLVSARACLPELMRRRGSIVVISSIAGLAAAPESVGYVASKHGLSRLARSMARDYGRHGVRVNTVCPGWVRTPMADEEMDQLAGLPGPPGWGNGVPHWRVIAARAGGGAGGDGGVGGDLVQVVAVEQLDAERVIHLAVEPGGQVAMRSARAGSWSSRSVSGAGWRSRSSCANWAVTAERSSTSSVNRARMRERRAVTAAGWRWSRWPALRFRGVLGGLDVAQPLAQRCGGGLVAGGAFTDGGRLVLPAGSGGWLFGRCPAMGWETGALPVPGRPGACHLPLLPGQAPCLRGPAHGRWVKNRPPGGHQPRYQASDG